MEDESTDEEGSDDAAPGSTVPKKPKPPKGGGEAKWKYQRLGSQKYTQLVGTQEEVDAKIAVYTQADWDTLDQEAKDEANRRQRQRDVSRARNNPFSNPSETASETSEQASSAGKGTTVVRKADSKRGTATIDRDKDGEIKIRWDEPEASTAGWFGRIMRRSALVLTHEITVEW